MPLPCDSAPFPVSLPTRDWSVALHFLQAWETEVPEGHDLMPTCRGGARHWVGDRRLPSCDWDTKAVPDIRLWMRPRRKPFGMKRPTCRPLCLACTLPQYLRRPTDTVISTAFELSGDLEMRLA